jgi:hypothetical protein
VTSKKNRNFDIKTEKIIRCPKSEKCFSTVGLIMSLPWAIRESMGLTIRNNDLTVTIHT